MLFSGVPTQCPVASQVSLTVQKLWSSHCPFALVGVPVQTPLTHASLVVQEFKSSQLDEEKGSPTHTKVALHRSLSVQGLLSSHESPTFLQVDGQG